MQESEISAETMPYGGLHCNYNNFCEGVSSSVSLEDRNALLKVLEGRLALHVQGNWRRCRPVLYGMLIRLEASRQRSCGWLAIPAQRTCAV